MKRLKKRVCMIASSALPPAAAGRHFNVRAATVLLHVAQLAKMPKSTLSLEVWAATMIFRLPGSGLSAEAPQELHFCGGPHVSSITAACSATLIRTAAAGKIIPKN